MSFYNDNHDYEIGPAPAGPAESAHNMTLQLNFLSVYRVHPAAEAARNRRATNQPTARR